MINAREFCALNEEMQNARDYDCSKVDFRCNTKIAYGNLYQKYFKIDKNSHK